MSQFAKIIFCIVALLSTVGFRITKNRWDISPTDPTLWIKVCPSSLVTIAENDIQESDPLQGVTGLTFSQVLQSVINDYNSIPTSYLRLALYPADPNNPGAPLAGDSTFTIAKAEKRTIEICFGETNPAAGLSGGYAMPRSEGSVYVGCKIEAKSNYLEKAFFLTHLLTHELGHCFGLMHPQEATNSVMSYFGPTKLRLKNDDYAGITYGYASDPSYAKEAVTLGLTGCTPQN